MSGGGGSEQSANAGWLFKERSWSWDVKIINLVLRYGT